MQSPFLHPPKMLSSPLQFGQEENIPWHFKKELAICFENCQGIKSGIKENRTDNLIYRTEDPIIPQHVKKVAIIYRTYNLDRDRSSAIANTLVSAAILILLKER